jgi:aspartyl-tRNA(Asn)/glutamyl-tRNA(Gln) amidotransferase subunit A
MPRETAEAVRRLEAAGYANVGKTNLHEFAYGVTSENPHFGTVPNPLAADRVAGGSSGGSAAAVAAGLADLGLGTDSGGSIRIPAACCGVTGFKPSYGLVPLDGCFPLAPSFDHAGPIGPDVASCVDAMRVLAPGFEPIDVDLADLAVGVAWLETAEPLVRERVAVAARLFPRARPVELPRREDAASPLFRHEVAGVHRELFAEHADLYGEDVRIKIERCLTVTDAEAEADGRARDAWREQAEAALADLDLLVTPTLEIVAPPRNRDAPGDLDVRERLIRNTFPFNAWGWPALALPCGPAEYGLPASIQLAGRHGTDALVLAAGLRLQHARGG